MVLVRKKGRVAPPRGIHRKLHFAQQRQYWKEVAQTAGGCLVLTVLFYWTLFQAPHHEKAATVESASDNKVLPLNHPNLHLNDPDSESYNVIAYDILQTLNCQDILQTTQEDYPIERDGQEQEQRRRRRLEQEGDFKLQVALTDDADAQDDRAPPLDDDEALAEAAGWTPPSGHHLFCLAAHADVLMQQQQNSKDNKSSIPKELQYWKEHIQCLESGIHPMTLLDLWSTARAEMPQDLLLETLDMARENVYNIVGKPGIYLWSPEPDRGLVYQLSLINDKKQHYIYGLEQSLGLNRLFVDVGSCLGLTGMAVSILYPGTRIVSIEAASPNWLLQEMNWRCNAPTLFPQSEQEATSNLLTVIRGGVGPSGPERAATMLWRPFAVTATRSWTKASERNEHDDREIAVPLRPWHSFLQQADLLSSTVVKIHVLHVDCEGCEYNLMPTMTADDFHSVQVVVGTLHWSLIPHSRKPSSKRAAETHQRLCQHEVFAITAKECCAFPDLPVTSRIPDQILLKDETVFPPQVGTISDVAGSLCDDFTSWAVTHELNSIESDWGWFQLSPVAEE